MTINPPGPHQPDETTTPKLRTIRRRTITLGVISALSYPVLTGTSRLIHLMSSRDGSAYPAPDPLSDFGIITFVVGLTLTVVLTFVYVALRDWTNPDTRSTTRVRRTILAGLIATPFSFALFAVIIAVINVLLHRSATTGS